MTAQVVASLLENAAFSGDKTLLDAALTKLRALDKFTNTVPRGAQTWEVPLHTPDLHGLLPDYFDSIPHSGLLARVRERVADGRVLGLLEGFLKQGVMEGTNWSAATRVGQENSFTWQRMAKGFEIQMPMIARLQQEGRAVVKTLGETGKWFKAKYPVTPPTSVTVLNGHAEKNLKTVWLNSRFYRANLLWERGTLRFRDIHLFDEGGVSDYLTKRGTSSQCLYDIR